MVRPLPTLFFLSEREANFACLSGRRMLLRLVSGRNKRMSAMVVDDDR